MDFPNLEFKLKCHGCDDILIEQIMHIIMLIPMIDEDGKNILEFNGQVNPNLKNITTEQMRIILSSDEVKQYEYSGIYLAHLESDDDKLKISNLAYEICILVKQSHKTLEILQLDGSKSFIEIEVLLDILNLCCRFKILDIIGILFNDHNKLLLDGYKKKNNKVVVNFS